MVNDKISVILPVYNAEAYLERCLTSICVQSHRNLEIICIDDGSKDSSGTILDAMAEADGRIYVVHQTNHGESHARNVGLDMATGEWIAFVDNDDWLEPDMYATLLHVGDHQALDLICSSWVKETGASSTKMVNEGSVSEEVFGRDELLRYIYHRDMFQGFAYMWNKLYRNHLFSELRFDETLRVGGDVLALAGVALYVKRAAYLDRHFYHYLQRSDSGCHTRNANKLLDWIVAYQKVIGLFDKNGVPHETMLYVKRFAAYTAARAAKAAIVSKDVESYRHAVSVMRQYQNEYEATNAEYPQRIQEFHNIMDWKWTS